MKKKRNFGTRVCVVSAQDGEKLLASFVPIDERTVLIQKQRMAVTDYFESRNILHNMFIACCIPTREGFSRLP